jgi:HD superfamily phosphodiesterase
MIYEEILKNKNYLAVVEKIENIKFITDGKWDWEHGLNHYKRVAKYVKKILKQLNADNRSIDLGMAAALLHDIGLSKSGSEKIDHAIKSSEMFRNFIEDTNITEKEAEIMDHAISDHSKGNNINSLIGLSLILADKLDVTYRRTENSSIQDKMNKEIQKIRDVDIVINDKDLIVKYITIGEFNLNILREWEVAITIPQKIANYLNKRCVFMINNKEIQIK